jgi:Flp pilus assembly protein TadG
MHLFTRTLRTNQQGVAAIEFALILPILILLLFGTTEMTRYLLTMQKVEKAAYVMTDSLGQFRSATLLGDTNNPANPYNGEISQQAITQIFAQAESILGVDNNAEYAIVFSSVVHTAGGERLRWQMTHNSATPPTYTSITGLPSIGIWPVGGQNGSTLPAGNPTTTCQNITFSGSIGTTISDPVTGMINNENYIIGEFIMKFEPLWPGLFTALFGDAFLKTQTIHRTVFLHPRNDRLWDLPSVTGATTSLVAENTPCSP